MKRLSDVPLFSLCGECGTGTRCCNDMLCFGWLVDCNHKQLDWASACLCRIWSHVYTQKSTHIHRGWSSSEFPVLSLELCLIQLWLLLYIFDQAYCLLRDLVFVCLYLLSCHTDRPHQIALLKISCVADFLRTSFHCGKLCSFIFVFKNIVMS